MMENPKISVIVPAYRVERYIRKCIDSILGQTFRDFELILIDDGSPDASGAICDEYASSAMVPKITVRHTENHGVSHARNIGLDNAHGEWISFIDPDDWVEPDYLEKLYKKATESNADVVLGGIDRIYEDGHREPFRYHPWTADKKESMMHYVSWGWNGSCGILHRKSLLDRTDLRFDEKVRVSEDFVYMLQLCHYANKVVTLDEYIYNYRQHSESVLHSVKTLSYEQAETLSLIRDIFKKIGCYKDYEVPLNWCYLKVSAQIIVGGDYKFFYGFHPEKNRHILTCPSIVRKMKLVMWMLAHHLKYPAICLMKLNHLRRKN